MNIDKNTSQRITIIRFPLVVGIVFIHSAANTLHFSDGWGGIQSVSVTVSFIQCFVSEVLARISVPLFFVISGFLFFQYYSWSLRTFLGNLKSRVITLLLPYFIWNSLALVVYFILQSIPSLSQFFSGAVTPVAQYNMYDYMNAYLGLQKSANSPLVYQFWFIRDLFIMVLISPFFWLAISYSFFISTACVSMLWLLSPNIIIANVSSSAVFFFFLGSALAIRQIDLSWLDSHGKGITLAYIICALLSSLLLMKNWQYAARINSSLVTFIGILSTWYLAGKILSLTHVVKALFFLSGSSFFIFATHEPFLLGGIRKLLYRYAPPTSSLHVLLYFFFVPLVVILISVCCDKMLQRWMPAFHGLLTGRR
jgi:surface polysaccharide O-acyltransferase-like enzyme